MYVPEICDCLHCVSMICSCDRTVRCFKVDMQEQGVPLASDQIQFSLLYRKHEKEGLLKTAKQLGVSVIGYSPLSQGLLTGVFLTMHAAPSDGRQLRFTFSI